jgi:hypothetical protein
MDHLSGVRHLPSCVLVIDLILQLFAHVADFDVVFTFGLGDRIAGQEATDGLDLPYDLLSKADMLSARP